MIHIYLDKTEVFPEKDTSIKITRENPVMTGSGSYTLDVNLPLSLPDNKKFFGDIDRIEKRKEYKTYSAELRDGNRTLLIGTAVLTKVTESVASVQFLAGNSNVRFWNNADTQYIDEYDYNSDAGVSDIVISWLNSMQAYKNDRYEEYGYEGVFYEIGIKRGNTGMFMGVEGKFASAPFYDEDKEPIDDNTPQWAAMGNVINGGSLGNDFGMMWRTPHANLLYVVRKLCEKRGYDVDLSYLQNTWVKDIYIASAIPTTSIAVTLPHWSVKEFFEQFCNLFNVTMQFDDVKMTMRFVDNRSFFKSSINITEIEDIFENEIEESGDANIMYSNIGYGESNNTIQNVGKSIRSKYPTYYAEGYHDVNRSFNDNGQNQWAFYGHDGEIYARDSDGIFRTCDIFRPMDRKSATDVEIKIVPAKTNRRKKFRQIISQLDSGYEQLDEMVTVPSSNNALGVHSHVYKRTITEILCEPVIRCLELQNGYGGYKKAKGSLWEKLSGDDVTEEKGEKESYMPIFLMSSKPVGVYALSTHYTVLTSYYYINEHGGYEKAEQVTDHRDEEEEWDLNLTTYCDMDVRIPFTDCSLDGWQHPDGSSTSEGCEASLSIAGSRKDNEIASFHRDCPKFNENSLLHVRFLSQDIPDVLCCFIIRGKRYACKKFEYILDENGINSMLEGYFVEILS